MVREAEPAEETIFPTADDDLADTPEEEDESLVRTETVDDTPEDDDVSKGRSSSLSSSILAYG